jgi:Na+/H+-dicarboxylate symporter
MNPVARFFRLPLYLQIFISLALAVGAGVWAGPTTALAGVKLVDVFTFVGALFLQALQMVVMPLIASAVITAVAGFGRDNALGRVGLKTVGYYLMTTLLAVLVGLAFIGLFRPGEVNGEPAAELLGRVQPAESLATLSQERGWRDVIDVFLRMFPRNIIEAASNNGSMLGVITFSILFGFCLARSNSPGAGTVRTFCDGVYEIMLTLTGLIMKAAPVGVFGLVASTAATVEWAAIVPLTRYFFTVLGALVFHALVTLPLLLLLVGRVHPWRHYRAVFPALLTAFSTSSSSATLPVTTDCIQRRAGVSPRTTNVVIPLGATVNMDGTALYECVVVLFIAQVHGIDLGFTGQLVVVVMALLTSIGVAGVPSASLVAIVVIMQSVGLDVQSLGMILVFDRLLDMCRTTVNVLGDTCGAVVIARTEGETLKI